MQVGAFIYLFLQKLTERRVLFFNHEVVPNYLRTKCEPAAEEKLHAYQTRANSIGPDPLQVLNMYL